MNWIEVIEIRSLGNNKKKLKSQIQYLLEAVEKEQPEFMMVAYYRSMPDSDFCIHITHCSKIVENEGSELGIQIASALKEYGIVNHRIWIEFSKIHQFHKSNIK